ncbi:MAG: hypothetical protein ABI587_04320 [Gemmatimonadales bacterium]
MSRRSWNLISWLLLVIWVTCGVLNMSHLRVALLTSYGADLTAPAWLYVTLRGLNTRRPRTGIGALVGRTPEIAGSLIVLGSTATEVSQLWWPHGLFPGIFDPLDIAAYFSGVGVCYALDRAFPIEESPPGAGLTG